MRRKDEGVCVCGGGGGGAIIKLSLIPSPSLVKSFVKQIERDGGVCEGS